LTASVFQLVDALFCLIILMIKYNRDAGATKVHYRTRILVIVVVVLTHFHEEPGNEVPQKPFFRLFSGLSSWRLFPVTHGAVVTKPNYCTFYIIHLRFLRSFSDTFNTLQPTSFPRFAFSCHLTWVRLDLSHGLVREYRPISVRTTIRGIKGGLESPKEEAGGGG